MITLASLWRYPIKGHGREELHQTSLDPDGTIPGDRIWAVAHDAAKAVDGQWAACANFSRGAKAPQLMAINARYDEDAGKVTLSHPEAGEITFDPDTEAAIFLGWVAPLMPADRAQSARIVRSGDRGMTDTPTPTISLASTASLAALSAKAGQPLDPARFRANIWLDGLAPWEEFDWVGKTLAIGDAQFHVIDRIERCLATTANPATGQRDVDTLGLLEGNWGHTDFGIYAEVTRGGTIRPGDTLQVL